MPPTKVLSRTKQPSAASGHLSQGENGILKQNAGKGIAKNPGEETSENSYRGSAESFESLSGKVEKTIHSKATSTTGEGVEGEGLGRRLFIQGGHLSGKKPHQAKGPRGECLRQ